MAFINTYNYVRKISEGHLQFYIDISIALEDSESILVVILWSHNQKQIMIVKNCGVLGTPLKQGHEAKNTNLNA
jgi:malate/lactate dehydrogenase